MPGHGAAEHFGPAPFRSPLTSGGALIRYWIKGLAGRPLLSFTEQENSLVDLARTAQTRTGGLPWVGEFPGPAQRIPGNGVYLRTDFWAPIHSGGSYGHTCYVAKSLAKMTDHLYCLMPHRLHAAG